MEQTIRSVVDQHYPNYEYLIFDGGSTDSSISIIKKYAQKHPQIKWQSKKDGGQVHALNKGLKKATGEIIAYINSDDYYLPGSFQKIEQYFKKNPKKEWLVGNCLVTKKSLNWTFFLKQIWPVHLFKFALNVFDTVNQPAVFLTNNLVKKVGTFSEKYAFAFDYDYWLRCKEQSLPGRLHSDIAVFRVHNDAKGSLSFQKQFIEDENVCKDYTSNKLVIYIHHIANIFTVFCYKFLK